MLEQYPADVPNVFLNVPYDESYERLLNALVACLLSLGMRPRCAFEQKFSEAGTRRLDLILELMCECRYSIHDISRQTVSGRFNMPFELGIACALSRFGRSKHDFIILVERKGQLDSILSDLKGDDERIHGNDHKRVLFQILDTFSRDVPPPMEKVVELEERMWERIPAIKQRFGKQSLFCGAVYTTLVVGTIDEAKNLDILEK